MVNISVLENYSLQMLAEIVKEIKRLLIKYTIMS